VNYLRHYNLLIEKARNRVLSGYVEAHHVTPVCVGGSDDLVNIVQLTAEEHYVAHQLLHKIYPNVPGLAFAMIAMTGKSNPHRRNKAYGWIRKRHAIAMSDTSSKMWKDEKYRIKHKASMDRLREDPEYVSRMAETLSKTHKGRIKSAQERLNIAEAGRNRAPRKFSDQAKRNMAEARRRTWEERRANGTHLEIAKKAKATRLENGGYKMSEEHRIAFSQSQKGKIPWNKGMKK